MNLLKRIFIFFYILVNDNSYCECCKYKNKHNIDIKNDDKKNHIINKDHKKEQRKIKRKEVKIDEKYLKDYKICDEKCFFEYENNNCSVKSTLSIFCKIFNKKKIIDDWLKSDNIVLKTLGEILDRYNKNDKSKKNHDIFFHNLLRFFVDYYNNNIKIQKSKEKPDKDFKEIMDIFLNFFGKYYIKEIKEDSTQRTFDDLFDNVENLEYRKYNDYLARFNISDLIILINKFYPLNYKNPQINYFQVENDIYATNFDGNFDGLFYISLTVKYGNIGHMCIIFKENNKFYFENCNKVFEINNKLVEACWENDNFQPIIDIYIKEGGINYKYEKIDEYLYQYKNKNIDDVICECTKNDLLFEYNYYKEYEKDELNKFTIESYSKYYNMNKDLIKKIFEELNINI